MKINRQNYESFFLDYIEGKLSSEDVAEVILFANLNPDLAEELNGLEQVILEPSTENFSGKPELKKKELPLDETQLDLLLSKEIEGDLSEDEKTFVRQLSTEYPFIQKSQRAFAKTKLPSEHLAFDEKSSLRFPDAVDYSLLQNLLIGKVEGDLSLEQNNHLASLLSKEQHLQSELAIFYKAKLKPERIVFAEKASLKQQETVKLIWLRYAVVVTAVAAALLFFWMSPVDPSVGNSVALKSNQLEINKTVATQKEHTNQPATNQSLPNNQDVAVTNTPQIVQPNDLATTNRVIIPQSITPLQFLGFDLDVQGAELAIHIELPDMNQIYHINDNEDLASNIQDGTFLTIRSFMEDRVKEELWGDNAYPKDNYTLALAQKTADKVFGKRESKMEMERINTDEEKSFRLRIGKFEFFREK